MRPLVFPNTRRMPHDSRGVAQPGRAPGSGPGSRRFKSSLPDQSFSEPMAYGSLPDRLVFPPHLVSILRMMSLRHVS
jgi:hypothetical protein